MSHLENLLRKFQIRLHKENLVRIPLPILPFGPSLLRLQVPATQLRLHFELLCNLLNSCWMLLSKSLKKDCLPLIV